MKNFKMLMIAAVSISAAALFNSCSEDDQFSIPKDGSVAGTYRLSAFNVPATDLNADGTASANLLSETDCYNDNFIRLNNNHTYAMTDNYVDASGGVQTCSPYMETGIWKKDGDVITLVSSESNGYTSHEIVLTNTGGTLTNTQDQGVYPGFDTNGNLVNAVAAVSYVYTLETAE